MTADWDPRFDDVLRARLRLLGPEQELDPAVRLADLGLDSMGTIQLLLELEEAYAVSFPDETLTIETFATAGSLWKVLSGLLAVGSEPSR